MIASPATENIAELSLRSRVDEQFARLDASLLADIRVGVEQRVVTLSGRVPTAHAKESVLHAARNAQGAAKVVDRIEVVPPAVKRASQTRTAPVTKETAAAKQTRGAPAFPRVKVAAAALATLFVLAIALGASAWRGPADGRPPLVPTSGHITFEGQPLATALLVFHPQHASPDAPRPVARVDKDGNFTLTTFNSGDGAPAGEYVVTAEWRRVTLKGDDAEISPNLLPARYGSSKTSDLKLTISVEQSQFPALTLSR